MFLSNVRTLTGSSVPPRNPLCSDSLIGVGIHLLHLSRSFLGDRFDESFERVELVCDPHTCWMCEDRRDAVLASDCCDFLKDPIDPLVNID